MIEFVTNSIHSLEHKYRRKYKKHMCSLHCIENNTRVKILAHKTSNEMPTMWPRKSEIVYEEEKNLIKCRIDIITKNKSMEKYEHH